MGKYALLIGIETYGKDGEVLQTLPAAPKDVAALREVLLNPKLGGFDEAKPLINPTQPEMAQEIELWFQDRQPAFVRSRQRQDQPRCQQQQSWRT